MSYTLQYSAGDVTGDGITFTDPSNATTRGRQAEWIQALESGDITVLLDGGQEEVLTLSAGESIRGSYSGVTDSDINFKAGTGEPPTGGTPGIDGPSMNVVATKTGAYSAGINELVPVDPTGGVLTITLPAITADIDGRRIRVSNASTSTTATTVVPTGTDTLNGLTSTTLAASRASKEFVADAVATPHRWHIFTSS